MTFSLQGGSVTVRVRIRQRFAHDGAHARQTAEGVGGGGDVVDSRAGLRVRNLAYTLTIRQ